MKMLCVIYLSLFYFTKAELSSNGTIDTTLDDPQEILLTDEAITPLNIAVLQANDINSVSTKYPTKTVLDYEKPSPAEIHNDTPEKDHSLFTCNNITLKLGEYALYDNGTLLVKAFRMTLNSSSYIENGDNTVVICKPNRSEKNSMPILGKVLLVFLTFAYAFVTMISAMCSFSKNNNYLQLAFVSWICVSSNIFLWIVVMLVIPGYETVFSWVSMSVNMNQSVFLTSAWMALLTSNRVMKFLQDYGFISISKRVVTIRIYRIGGLCALFAAAVASVNLLFHNIDYFEAAELIDCLFCDPIVYSIICVMVFVEGFSPPLDKNQTDVTRDYAAFHYSLCIFSIFNFLCIAIGSIAVVFEWHSFLWIYTLFAFLWPLFFIKYIIPSIQTSIALASEDDEEEQKILINLEEKVPLKKDKELEI